MGTSKSFEELGAKLVLAGENIRLARAASFRSAQKNMQPRFREQAVAAAGSNRVLSRHRSKAALDAEFKITDGDTTTLLFITPQGPWGIRDNTDTSGKTKGHTIKPRTATFLRFVNDDGDTVFAKVVNHPGSKRENYWDRARKVSLRFIGPRLALETRAAIEAALNNTMYKSRSE